VPSESSPHQSHPSAITQDWFARPSCQVAPDLLGCYLVRSHQPQAQAPQSLAPPFLQWSRIVETEAYGPNPGQPEDPAMHLYRKPTPKKAVVFGPAGFTYVYSIYGKYHCFNVVTDQDRIASTILIRAVELLAHGPVSRDSASAAPDCKRGAGPSKLCIALDIDRSLSQLPTQPGQPTWLAHRLPDWQRQWDAGAIAVTQTQRIGLSKGTDLPWRWYLNDSPAVSKR